MKILGTIFPDYFTQEEKRNVIILFLSSIVVLIAWWKLEPSSLGGKSDPIAVIEHVSRNVKYKDSFTLSFYEGKSGILLHNNDEVFATEDSMARIKFLNSNNMIVVPSSSLVRIESTKDGDVIEVKEGSIDLNIEKNKTIKVKVNGEERVLGSTESSQTIKLQVVNGQIEEQKVDANKTVEFKILKPLAGYIEDLSNGLKIKINKKLNYTVSLFKNSETDKVIKKINFKGTEAVLNFPFEDDDYLLKIESGGVTKSVLLNIRLKYKINNMSPADGEILKLNVNEKINLKWAPVATENYKIKIKTSSGNEKEITTKASELILDDFVGEEFWWTVSPEISSGIYSSNPAKAVVKVRYIGNILLLPNTKTNYVLSDKMMKFGWQSPAGDSYRVELKDFKDEKIIFQTTVKSKNIEIPIKENGKFNLSISSVEYKDFVGVNQIVIIDKPIGFWKKLSQEVIKSIEDYSSVDLDVELEKNFSGSIYLKHTYNNKIENLGSFKKSKVELKGFGKHCYVVAMKTKIDGYLDTDEYCVNLVQVPPFPALPKAKDIIMSYEKENEEGSYKIEVPKVSEAKTYYIEIYSDKAMKNLIYKMRSSSPVQYWLSNRSGIFYLKYKVYDAKNRPSEFSPPSKIMFPISPLSSW